MAERTPSSRQSSRRRAAPYPNARPGKPDSALAPPSSQATFASMFSGLFNFLLRPFSGQSQSIIPLSDSNSGTLNVPCALNMSDRGEEMEHEARGQRPPPAQAVPPPPPRKALPQSQSTESAAGPSGTSTYTAVAAFLVEKARNGQKLNTTEYLDLMPLLDPNDREEKREPFRFSNSPSLPVIGSSASNGLFASNSTPYVATSGEGQPQRAPRMLSKNPNGDLQRDGFGDARRRKQNRYQSASFGRTRQSARITLNPKAFTKEEKPEVKGKKRRVEEPPKEASSSQSNGNAGSQQPATDPRTNGAPPQPATPPRARPALKSKPAVPSPLRQAWGADPDSPPSSLSVPTASGSATKPTRAAAAMVELIKEASPKSEAQKRREAYANPYEEMCPVPVKPVIRQTPWKRKVGETEKPEEKSGAKKLQKEKEVAVEKEPPQMPLSPQRIIEATVPKGAKRSRPPPGFEKAKQKESQDVVPPSEPALRRSARLKSPEAAGATVGSGFFAQPNKTVPPLPSVVIQEVPDELPHKKARTAAGTNGFSKARTVTVEEIEDVDMSYSSKPTTSVIKPVEVIEIEDEDEPEVTQKEKSPSPTSHGLLGVNGFATTSKLPPLNALKTSAPRVSSKLRYSFGADKEDTEDYQGKGKGKQQEKQSATNGLDLLSAAAVPNTPKLAAATLPTPSPFGAATAKPPGPSPFGGSSFFAAPSATPMSSYTAPPTLAPSPLIPPPTRPAPKTTEEIKNVIRVMAVYDLPVYNFDITHSSPGAGPSTLKAREAAKVVPASSLPTFDFSAPVVAKQPTTAASGFNWAAAGMKQPAQTDEWACAECTLKNPASVTDKCKFCEAPRAGAAPAPAKGGFDWSAAGMKPPVATDEWTCAECTLKNSVSVKDKCKWCESPRPGAAPATPQGGFDWAAAGLKKPGATDEWECAECTLKNPMSVKDKCQFCEARRPGATAAAAPVATGFNWAAAGMKKPESSGGWTCSTCMVPNVAAAKKCVSCETDR